MYSRTIAIILSLLGALLALAGCATTPRYRGIAAESTPGLVLGVTVDKELRVVEVEANSAAQKAGVQVGDQLTALTWILSEVPEEVPSSGESAPLTTGSTDGAETNTATQTAASTPIPPPPGVETRTVPFTEHEEIVALISYGVPLRLRVLREGQARELTIIPARPVGGEPGSGAKATATPVMPPYAYY